MLSKKINWSILAQCDYYAVERFVVTEGRQAMRTIQPINENVFDRKIVKEQFWKNAYEVVSDAYKQLPPAFSIVPDSFGGYRLVYKGKKMIFPPEVLRGNPVGFVRPVPDGAVSDLSVMSSEKTGEQLLLLGPVRFVNSDCEPNCEFDFSSDSGIVQLRVKKRICFGDEILVKYDQNFSMRTNVVVGPAL